MTDIIFNVSALTRHPQDNGNGTALSERPKKEAGVDRACYLHKTAISGGVFVRGEKRIPSSLQTVNCPFISKLHINFFSLPFFLVVCWGCVKKENEEDRSGTYIL